jgi:hypothetical protein
MENGHAPPPLLHDVNFELTSDGYEIWFSDHIASDHPVLVDEFADWLQDEVGAMNLGQIDHNCVLADGVLSDQLRQEIWAWWAARVDGVDLG